MTIRRLQKAERSSDRRRSPIQRSGFYIRVSRLYKRYDFLGRPVTSLWGSAQVVLNGSWYLLHLSPHADVVAFQHISLSCRLHSFILRFLRWADLET